MKKYIVESKIILKNETLTLSPISFSILKKPFKKVTTVYLFSFSVPFSYYELLKPYLNKTTTSYKDFYVEIALLEYDTVNNFRKKIYSEEFVLKSVISLEFVRDVKQYVYFKTVLIPKKIFEFMFLTPSKNVFEFNTYSDIFEQIFSEFKSRAIGVYDHTIKHKNIPPKLKFQKIMLPKTVKLIDAPNFVTMKYKTHLLPTFYFCDSFNTINYPNNEKYTLKGISFYYENSVQKKDISSIPLKIAYKKSVSSIFDESIYSLLSADRIVVVDEIGNVEEIVFSNGNKVEVIQTPDNPSLLTARVKALKQIHDNIREIAVYKVEDIYPFSLDIGVLYSLDGKKYTSTLLNQIITFVKESTGNLFRTKMHFTLLSYEQPIKF